MYNKLFTGITFEDRRFFKEVEEQSGGFLQFCQNNLEDFCNFEKVSASLWHLQVGVTAVGIFP